MADDQNLGLVLPQAQYDSLVKFISERMAQLPNGLVNFDPNSAFALAQSNMSDGRLNYTSNQLLKAFGGMTAHATDYPGDPTQLWVGGPLKDRMGVGAYDLPDPSPLVTTAAGGLFGSGQDTLRQLPPELQSLANWLRQWTSSVDPTISLTGPKRPHPLDDELSLANLVLEVQRRGVTGDRLEITLDSQIQGWLTNLAALEEQQHRLSELPPGQTTLPTPEQLATYKQAGQVTPQQRFAEQKGEVPSVPADIFTGPQPGGGTPEEIRRNGLRAQALLYAIQTLDPEAQVRFRDKGLLGGIVQNYTDFTNVVTYPVTLGLREAGAAVGTGLNALGLNRGGYDPSFASPVDVFNDVTSANGFAYGEQLARGYGLHPGDPAWNVLVPLTDFLVSWEVDPGVLLGKIGVATKALGRLPEGSVVGRGLSQAVFDRFAVSSEALVEGFDAGRLLRTKSRLWAKGEDPTETLKRFYGMDADVARAVVSGSTPAEVRANLVDFFDGVAAQATPSVREGWATEKFTLEQRLADLEATGQKFSPVWGEAVQRQRLLAARLTSSVNPKAATVLRELPQPSFWRAIKEQVSTEVAQGLVSREFGRVMETLSELHIPGTRPRISRFWLDLPDRYLRNPRGLDARPGDLTKWADSFDGMMRDYGVDAASRRRVVNALTEAAGRENLFETITKDVTDAIQGAVDRINGVTRTPAEALADVRPHSSRPIINWFKSMGPRTRGIVPEILPDGRVTWGPTIYSREALATGGWVPHPLPGSTSELLHRGVVLPDHGMALDATGFWRRSKVGRSKAWRAEQTIMDTATRWWKDSILLGRAPAVLFRTQSEQAARIAAFGHASMLNRPWEWMKYALDNRWDEYLLRELEQPGRARIGRTVHSAEAAREFDKLLGMISEQVARDSTISFRDTWQWSQLLNEADQRQMLNVWRTKLHRFHSDPGLNYLAVNGPEEFARWLQEDLRGQAYAKEMGSIITEKMDVPSGVDRFTHYAERNYAEWNDLVRGDPELATAIKNGYASTLPSAKGSEVKVLLDWVNEIRVDAAASEAAGELTTAGELYSQARRVLREATRELNRSGKKALRRYLDQTGTIPPSRVEEAVQARAYLDTHDFNDYLWDRVENQGLRPPEYLAGEWSAAVAGQVQKGQTRNWLYRNLLGREDKFLSRSPLYRQFAEQRFQELLNAGIKKSVARRQAAFWAVGQSSDALYDLAGRTSAQKFFRNIAPFFPAWQEIITTWMWKIPSRYGPVVGHVYLADRARLLLKGFNDLGIDPTGRIPVPGLSNLLANAFGGPNLLPTFRPTDLNLVLQTTFPGLGPVQGVALGAFAKKYDGFFDTISDIFLPYGNEIQLGPASLNRAWEGICRLTHDDPQASCAPIWEQASAEKQNLYLSYSMTDAIRATWTQFFDSGDTPPDPQSFPDEASFRTANDKWMGRLIGTARRRAGGILLARSLLGAIAPAPIQITDEVKQDLQGFYDQLDRVARRSPEAAALYDAFFAEHPFADLYLTPSSLKDHTLSPNPADSVFQQILEGFRDKLSPEAFVNMGEGLYSRRLYEKLYLSELNTIGTSSDILRDWAGRKDARAEYLDRINRYESFNADFKPLWDRLVQTGSLPGDSYEVERLRKFANLAGILAEDQFSTDAVPGVDFNSIRAQIGQTLSEQGVYGPPRSDLDKALDWYFNVGPGGLLDQMDVLRKQAVAAPTGAAASEFYDKIRRLLNGQKEAVGPDGQSYPTLEAFLWGAKDETAQNEQKLRWALRPVEWLSGFQRDKVYGNALANQGYDKFMDYVNDTQKTLDEAVKKNRISTSSTLYESLQNAVQGLYKQKAQELGVRDAAGLLDLAPYRQLEKAGLYIDIAAMQHTFDAAQAISGYLADQGLSAKGHSQKADQLKQPLYTEIDRLRDNDQAFDAAWLEIQDALKPLELTAHAHAAYDAVLFSDFFGL